MLIDYFAMHINMYFTLSKSHSNPKSLTKLNYLASCGGPLELHVFVVLQIFVNYCYKGFQATQIPLNKGHEIEASYIIVHSYDILVINTPPWFHLVLI